MLSKLGLLMMSCGSTVDARNHIVSSAIVLGNEYFVVY